MKKTVHVALMKSIAVSLLFISYSVLAHSGGGIVIKDAWVREAPPTTKVMAAYLSIENHTDKQAILKEISSSSFNRVEIHKNILKNGMSAMKRQQQLIIPAQGSVDMKSQGYHLMLFNPASALKAGDTVKFSLKFADGKKSAVTAEVKKATGENHHDHMNMDHKNM